MLVRGPAAQSGPAAKPDPAPTSKSPKKSRPGEKSATSERVTKNCRQCDESSESNARHSSWLCSSRFVRRRFASACAISPPAGGRDSPCHRWIVLRLAFLKVAAR